MPKPSDPTSTYTCTYDAWNRLVEVSAGETLLARYTYDGLGRRVKVETPQGETTTYRHFFYTASWQVLETRTTTTSGTGPDTLPPERQFVWSLRYLDAPVLRWRDGNTDGDLEDEGDSTLYYATDANMNVTALVNASNGSVVERVVYDPYGKATFYDGSWANPSTTSAYANEVLYTGHRLDPESGLYYTLFRHYHPTLGRWLQRDPLGYVDGMSLYAYCRSGPLGATDPLGQAADGFGQEMQRLANAYRGAAKSAGYQLDQAAEKEGMARSLDMLAEMVENPDLAKKLRKEAEQLRAQAAVIRQQAANEIAAVQANLNVQAQALLARMGPGNGRAAGGNPDDDTKWYDRTWYDGDPYEDENYSYIGEFISAAQDPKAYEPGLATMANAATLGLSESARKWKDEAWHNSAGLEGTWIQTTSEVSAFVSVEAGCSLVGIGAGKLAAKGLSAGGRVLTKVASHGGLRAKIGQTAFRIYTKPGFQGGINMITKRGRYAIERTARQGLHVNLPGGVHVYISELLGL